MREPSIALRARGRAASWPLLATAWLGVAACGHRQAPELPAPLRFSAEVREILATDRPSAEFYDARSRLAEMGPEVDAVLVTLARDERAKPVARANAMILLAERGSSAALPVLSRALLGAEVEMLRSAAVLGLQRLASESDAARRLIRSALGDPARTVRLNALQALDIREVEAMRALLATETDREVRQVAMQLVALAESRGAPLAADQRGALRTTGLDTDAQLVFRPMRVDSVAGYAVGDLRVELPHGRDVPLAASAEVVAGVVPAFFSPDRAHVVYEVEREIRVFDLTSRAIRSLGPGIAPRLVPFTHQFVFLREQPERRRERGDQTELRYEVFRAAFAAGEPEPIGELHAVARPGEHANYSPVRWMVVAETPDGFALQGPGVSPFLLPSPIWRPAPGGGGHSNDLRP